MQWPQLKTPYGESVQTNPADSFFRLIVAHTNNYFVMSESNGTATRNRISRDFPKPNGSTLERGERNGNASGRQRIKHEGRTALSLGLGSRVRRVAMGVATVVVLIAGVWFTVMADSETGTGTPATPRVLAVQTISVEPVSAYQEAREYTGAIVARRTSQLGFELAGKLEQIYVD